MDILKSLTTTAQLTVLTSALSGCTIESFPPTRRAIQNPDNYAQTHLPKPSSETTESITIRLNDLLRNAYKTDYSGQLRIVHDIYNTYKAYYARVLRLDRTNPNFANRLDTGAIAIHDYILNNPHIDDKEKLLLRSLVLGERSLVDVLCIVATQERTQTLPENQEDLARVEEGQQAMHWALYRYAGGLAYEAAARLAYQEDTNSFDNISPSLKEYINQLDYNRLRNLFTNLDINWDSLFNPENPSCFERYPEIIRLIESERIASVDIQEVGNIFNKIKMYAASRLRRCGDTLTPLTIFPGSRSQYYWTGFRPGFDDFMREADIAVETPDPLDNRRLLRPFITDWWPSYQQAYSLYTGGQRTYQNTNSTEQWFQRTLPQLGSSVSPTTYRQYANNMTLESTALTIEDENHIWREEEIEARVSREGVAILSPDQLPRSWRTLLESVTLDIPFPNQNNFRGNAFEFIKKYTFSIYFTRVRGTREEQVGTIAASESAVFISVGSPHTYSTLRIIDTLVHETYHLAYHEEVISKNPSRVMDRLLEERNAYLVGMQTIEAVIPRILRDDILSSYHPAHTVSPIQRAKTEGEIAHINFALASISLSFTILGIENHDDFYAQLTTGAAWCYLNNQSRVRYANSTLGYPNDNREIRYDGTNHLPASWRGRYPQYNDDVHLFESFRGATRTLFRLAGFDMTKVEMEIDNPV
ncbi:MAG: hypothetical protein IPJ69_13020 [Deltaproteobacteria bacterium]|nr:MAG: hypothetical protein IPJ69_13020 [Deltaproteobacteria bacterium]